MIRPVTTDDRFETMLDRSTPTFAEAVNRLIRAQVTGVRFDSALAYMAQVLGQNIAVADLLGRESAARTARAIHLAGRRYQDIPLAVVPKVPFTEAVADIAERTPEIARWATPAKVSEIIRNDGFTLAKAANLTVVKRVQAAITKFLAEGKSVSNAAEIIAEMGDWTVAYSATAYRTTISTAFANGRFEQVREPEMRAAIPAMRFSAVMDDSVTMYCKPLDGFAAPVDHPQWARIKPPNHFNCRSSADFIDVFDWQNVYKGRPFFPANFAKGGPAPGFVKSGF